MGSSLCRFQKPALGPFMTKLSVQRASPRRFSGLCLNVVRRVETESTKTSLILTKVSRCHLIFLWREHAFLAAWFSDQV